jgi:hypothetical protein
MLQVRGPVVIALVVLESRSFLSSDQRRRTALLGRLRVERRANGDASSVMASAYAELQVLVVRRQQWRELLQSWDCGPAMVVSGPAGGTGTLLPTTARDRYVTTEPKDDGPVLAAAL